MPPNATTFNIGEQTFGPASLDDFDFTPLFENALLSIVPSVILLLALPFRLHSLQKRSTKVYKTFLHGNKLAFLAVFTAFQAIVLVLYAANTTVRDPIAIAAAALVFADSIGLCFLSHAEHIRTIRPSTIINTYLFTTLLFDIARTRTLWIQHAPIPLAGVVTTTTIVKLAVAILEAVEKRGILMSSYQDASPEATSGIYSRSVFWWLNSIMRTGYARNVTFSDLFPIDEDMSSAFLGARAQTTWNAYDKTRKHALFWSTLSANRYQFFICFIPRLLLVAFRYAQPFLISRTVDFVTSTNESIDIGWGLVGAFLFVYIGKAVVNGSYYHMAYRFVTSVRGSLVSMIYMKTVNLSIISLDESAAITLMSSDAENICTGFANIHELWAVPIEIVLAAYLLKLQLGLVFLAPAAVALVGVVCIVFITRYVGPAQKTWMGAIQTRVNAAANMLGSMKAVKMLGFTDIITDLVQGLRVEELRLSLRVRRLLCTGVFFNNSMRILSPTFTWIFFVIASRSTGAQLTSSKAFTSLSLLSLVASPINTLLRTIPALISALACFGRIQTFLEADTLQRHVLPLEPSNSLNIDADPTSEDGIELQPLRSKGYRNPTVIDVRNASFSWNYEKASAINDVTFTVQRSTFIFVVGPVGSGKSTLLKGLMSETPSSKGFVYSSAMDISFVDQTPWVQNLTIQQNITGQSTFDEIWYERVIRACALSQDIENLPSKDDTLVGSQGISLSGGQKQRLTLARAVYAKKELMIIDDAFSGLDAETEEFVFAALFGRQGLLRQLGTTVIFATHAVHRASYADHIIALNQSGQISEQGTFEKLTKAGGYLQSLAIEARSHNGKESEDPDASPSRKGPPTSGVASAEDDNPFHGGDLSTYKYYFAAIGLKTSIMSMSLLVFTSIVTKLSELLLQFWTAAVAKHGNEVNNKYLSLYCMITGFDIILFISGVFYFFMTLVPISARKLHARLLKAVMGAPLHFFSITDAGSITNRFSQDMTVVDSELPYAVIDFVYSLIQAIMEAILICLSAGYFTLTMPPVVFAVWVIQKYYLRTSRQIRILDLEAKSPLYSHFIESLSGLVTIRAFGWSDNFIRQNLALLDASQKPYYLLFCIQRWLGLVLDLMVSGLALILMVLIVKLRDSISASYVGLALLNIVSFGDAITYLLTQWTAMETSIGAIARLKIFAETTPVENLAREVASVPEDWPGKGEIDIKNLSAAYTSSKNQILHELNLKLRPGEKIGICGRSGSGKSSLLMTLFRMLEIPPTSSIIIDGIDITTIPRDTVRSRLNAIPQDPFFLKGSVRFNADPSSIYTDDDAAIISALEKVHLWPTIQAKGGLAADLTPEFFSHGQRQLFCLARAILRKSKVVILDEVTSSVDVDTDRLMQSIIRDEFAECTLLVVAHRLGTIRDCDRIVVLSEGRVIEEGEPEDLLTREGGAFWELWNS